MSIRASSMAEPIISLFLRQIQDIKGVAFQTRESGMSRWQLQALVFCETAP
jgi:hypothetical protein